jgi:hypothetical protein
MGNTQLGSRTEEPARIAVLAGSDHHCTAAVTPSLQKIGRFIIAKLQEVYVSICWTNLEPIRNAKWLFTT